MRGLFLERTTYSGSVSQWSNCQILSNLPVWELENYNTCTSLYEQ